MTRYPESYKLLSNGSCDVYLSRCSVTSCVRKDCNSPSCFNLFSSRAFHRCTGKETPTLIVVSQSTNEHATLLQLLPTSYWAKSALSEFVFDQNGRLTASSFKGKRYDVNLHMSHLHSCNKLWLP